MTTGFLFWLLMLLWLVFGWFNRPAGSPTPNYGWWGGNLVLFVLLFLLGWKVFGFPIQG